MTESANLTVVIPVKTVAESSNGSHSNVYVKAKRKKDQHETVRAWLTPLGDMLPEESFPMVVTLVRMSAGTMDDDGLRSSLKYVRDAIALWLGVDDGDTSRVQYHYGQAKCKKRQFGVRVTFRPRTRLVERLEAV
jgi:hypothetical protein